ncbi:phosphoribosyltransferase [Streptomyces sp. NPDC002588]|uniref:phosphoribosyltransferase n=1 Tax=Streptomyces sp. NPDC002588 TaxID=3154419 RepID=UPI00332D0575
MRFEWPAFIPDGRANSLKDYSFWELVNRKSPDRWLYMCGPEEAAKQVMLTGVCTAEEVPEDKRREWSHAFRLNVVDQRTIHQLCELLKSVLCLTVKSDLNFAIAFDWYKDPVGDDPMTWPNTASGELIYRSKYYGAGTAQARAETELLDKYVAVINKHPLLRECPTIATIPGHRADGRSFGERLARKVASMTGKTLVETQSPGGQRPQAKEGAVRIADNHFAMPQILEGDVIVLDDVYGSGTTMAAVAKTAKRAGAEHAFGLVAVRRMRN